MFILKEKKVDDDVRDVFNKVNRDIEELKNLD